MRRPRSNGPGIRDEASEILDWPDSDVAHLAKLTAKYMATGLSRSAASLRGYLELRKKRRLDGRGQA